jgi:hypothetical protein
MCQNCLVSWKSFTFCLYLLILLIHIFYIRLGPHQMELALHRMDFELGYAGMAFIGHAFALLRLVNQCRAKSSMELVGVSLPTVDSFRLIVASEVSFQFSHLIPCYLIFLVDLSRIHHDTLFVSEYQHIPIRKSLSHCCHYY